MIKKEFEKESYLAPQWGMRMICVQRHLLNVSDPDSNPDITGDDVVDDSEGWGN